MELNADFSKRAIVHAAELEWTPSPMAGVHRRMLDRIGDEVARATSIVRYAPGSHFSEHTHTGGEEFLVLEGVFQDEHGDFPAGTYVRNPPTSKHTPRSDDGCVIFVKLWQFDPDDRRQVTIDPSTVAEDATAQNGVASRRLWNDENERVTFERWEADTAVTLRSNGGLELLVLEGEFTALDQTFRKHSWLRLPPDDAVELHTTSSCRVWVKRDHLADPIKAPA